MRLAVAALLVAAGPARAETYRVADAAGFTRAVAAARPGDTILLAPGEYANNFHFRGVHGAAGRPIVIAAADPDRPPRFLTLHHRGWRHHGRIQGLR